MVKTIDAIAKNVVEGRGRLNLTQAEFAHKAEISARSLQELEGRKTDPRVSTIEKIANFLKIYPSDLLKGPEQKKHEAIVNAKSAIGTDLDSLKQLVVDQYTARFQPPRSEAKPLTKRDQEIQELIPVLASLNESQFAKLNGIIRDTYGPKRSKTRPTKRVARKTS